MLQTGVEIGEICGYIRDGFPLPAYGSGKRLYLRRDRLDFVMAESIADDTAAIWATAPSTSAAKFLTSIAPASTADFISFTIASISEVATAV